MNQRNPQGLASDEGSIQDSSVSKFWHWPSSLAQGRLPNSKSKSSDQVPTVHQMFF